MGKDAPGHRPTSGHQGRMHQEGSSLVVGEWAEEAAVRSARPTALLLKRPGEFTKFGAALNRRGRTQLPTPIHPSGE